MGVARERNVKFMYEKEIEKLEMTPEKWYELNSILSDSEYSRIVMDYQEREFRNLPKCNSIFGVCRYFTSGRCNYKGKCRHKGK